ncbi:metal ABC transporter ATP-binding protein [Pilimelia terevasa]|uniref:metal ABC transporter ATP-binding protein n=1 Tax=Pilimelia terevasa TaxID=53372 RepID=UPI00166ADDE5|nr:metal ABC transporter ATP-binding protein [Pilimelia terevasa]
MSGPAVVEVAHLTVAFGERAVLRGVDARVGSGEVVAVMGANGSGKSTLVRAVLGLIPADAGQVRLFDTPLRRFRQWHRLGYVPQRLGAGSGVPATVAEVVAAGLLARRGLLRPYGRGRQAAVAGALAAVGLADRADDPVATLSGGQQQRTLIARALAGGPELLVLDEPTAGVDAASQEAFAAAVGGFVDGGGTVLVVLHEAGPLRRLLTRALVVADGRVVHDGAVPQDAVGYDHVHPHGPPNGTELGR